MTFFWLLLAFIAFLFIAFLISIDPDKCPEDK